MTLDQAIEKLTAVRNELGGDTPFCIENKTLSNCRIKMFDPAHIDVYRTNQVSGGSLPHWVTLMEGNKSEIVVVW